MRNIFIFFQICQLEGKIIQLTSFYLLPACESNIKHLFYFLNDLYASKQVQNASVTDGQNVRIRGREAVRIENRIESNREASYRIKRHQELSSH